jgi:hypothetical protein
MLVHILQSVKFAQLKSQMQIHVSSPSVIRYGLLLLLTLQVKTNKINSNRI